MDIVFYASSLNYDQGSGNYQELKKITKWDGKQYTFVSRYALRYSLLETGRKLGLWEVAGAKELLPEKNQQVVQPSEDLLLSGKILEYPEFDLFGYLITSTQPQNFREAPVKISHAVSLTPFNYDALFNANIGLANRIRKHQGEMSPNPFTSEEHFTFYQYSLVIDVDRLGDIEVYLSKTYKENKQTAKIKEFKIDEVNTEKKIIKFNIKYGKLKKFFFEVSYDENKESTESEENKNKENIILKNVTIPLSKSDKDVFLSKDESIKSLFNFDENLEVVIVKYKVTNVISRIKNFIKAVLNLHRSIKSRDEDLSPKLLILGLYENEPYKTYKDKIVLKDEYTEEEYDEILEKEENGKIIRKVIHKVSKSKKPVFEVIGNNFECIPISKIEEKISGFIEKEEHNSSGQKSKKNNLNKHELQNSKEPSTEKSSENEQLKYSKVYLAHSPEIKVKFDKVEDSNEARNSE